MGNILVHFLIEILLSDEGGFCIVKRGLKTSQLILFIRSGNGLFLVTSLNEIVFSSLTCSLVS